MNQQSHGHLASGEIKKKDCVCSSLHVHVHISRGMWNISTTADVRNYPASLDTELPMWQCLYYWGHLIWCGGVGLGSDILLNNLLSSKAGLTHFSRPRKVSWSFFIKQESVRYCASYSGRHSVVQIGLFPISIQNPVHTGAQFGGRLIHTWLW